MNNKMRQEKFLDKKDTEAMFGLYQLKRESRLRDYAFTNFETLTESGKKVKRDNYNLIYAAPLTDGYSLDHIYTEFNISHPADFTGHSLSVSDVIVLKQGDNQYSAYFVDSFDFEKIPDFMPETGRQRRQSGAEM